MPTLRTGTNPAPSRMADGRRDHEAARLDPDDLVDALPGEVLGQPIDDVGEARRRRPSSGVMSLKPTPGFGKSGMSRIERREVRSPSAIGHRAYAVT